MARLEQLERNRLTARQQALYDDIMRTRPRGKLSGPFSVWIHRPDIAEPANALANCFRVSPTLDKRLIELIVLLVCRDANAQYAWSAHFNLAREAGLTGETIEPVRARRRPEFGRDDERIVYDLVTELLASKSEPGDLRARRSRARARRHYRGRHLRRLLRNDRIGAQYF